MTADVFHTNDADTQSLQRDYIDFICPVQRIA